jgi:hypothetical protein
MLVMKKMYLLEGMFNLVIKKEDIVKLMNYKIVKSNVKEILNKISKKNLSLRYKLFLFIIKQKNLYFLKLYAYLRKKIKNFKYKIS